MTTKKDDEDRRPKAEGRAKMEWDREKCLREPRTDRLTSGEDVKMEDELTTGRN
jgi:hypothetical protein